MLQEIKAQEPQFPRLEVEAAGYKMAIVGQKGFNGVALLSLHPFDVTARALPGHADDEPARYIEGRVFTPRGPLTVGGIYLPNGNPIGTEKFAYKLAWMERLLGHARELLAREEMFVLGGDYNVCPTELDVYDPVAFANDALCQPQSRAALRTLINLGLTDAVRAFHLDDAQYTFWDYQAGAWQKDNGLQDRPPAALAAGRRPPDRRRHRQGRTRQDRTVRPRSGVVRARRRGLERYELTPNWRGIPKGSDWWFKMLAG